MAVDPLTAGMELAGNVINKIWPDKTEKEKQELAAAMMIVQGQLDINKAEAGNASVFVAGWRPFVGWVCGTAFAFKFIGGPLAVVVMAAAGHPIVLPVFDFTEVSTLLFALLGLGSMRTVEKIKGAA